MHVSKDPINVVHETGTGSQIVSPFDRSLHACSVSNGQSKRLSQTLRIHPLQPHREENRLRFFIKKNIFANILHSC
jgi:hypothetical protein